MKHMAIIFGSISSAILLVAFLFINYYLDGFLKLDTQWLTVALVPLIIALLVGGYVKKFKGFGIELESSLREPVGSLALIMKAADALEELPGEIKQSESYIASLTQSKKDSIRRLVFVEGRIGYYQEDAIEYYLRNLIKLEFFEIRDIKKRCVCLLPIFIFKEREEMNFEQIRRFIASLEERNVLFSYRDVALADKVSSDESLIEALPKVRSSKFGTLLVVERKYRLIGIINERAIEKRIADAVLSDHKRI